MGLRKPALRNVLIFSLLRGLPLQKTEHEMLAGIASGRNDAEGQANVCIKVFRPAKEMFSIGEPSALIVISHSLDASLSATRIRQNSLGS